MTKLWLISGAAYGLVGVMFGAFGAHALRERLSEPLLRAWQTGVEYQFYHAFALLGVGLLMQLGITSTTWSNAAGWAFALGVLLFSGSLYMLALGGPRIFGPVTPLGGLILIIGWGCLLVAVARGV